MNPNGNDCEPCLREGINVEATVYCLDCSEILCEDCKRHHKKSKLLLNHKLIDTSDELAGKIDFTDLEYLANLSKCPIHSTEGVKYLCKNHDQLCCNECAIVNHRKCEDIESLADEIKVKQEESKEFTIAKRLDTVDSYVEKLIKHESTYLVNIGMKENEEKACLKDLKAKLDDAYNKLETRIMFGWSEMQQALSKSSSLQKESAANLRDEIRQCGQKIKKAREFGIETNLFLLEREMAKKVLEYEENFTALRQHSSKILITLSEASPLQEILTNIEDIYQVEELKVEPLLPSFKTTKDFKKRTLALEHEVMLNVDLPYFCLWIGNYIVLSYSKSSKLEAYKADDGSLLTTYHWCSSPTSVTATENDEFAVASSSSNKINIMKFKQSQIIFLRKLACPNLDLIAYDEKNKHLLSLCWSGTVIRMITLDGRYIGFIDLIGIVQSPCPSTLNFHVDSQSGHIFISSQNSCTLLCIDMSGSIIFKHEIGTPWSAITDSQGNVYIVSCSGNSIQQLTPNGQPIRSDILGDCNVAYPVTMCFNKEMDKMVVICGETPVKMKIFKFE